MVDVPLSTMPSSTSPQLATAATAVAPSPSSSSQQQPSSSTSSSTPNVEEARRQKRKEQNRLAQRRHREKARFELKRQRLDNGTRVGGEDDGEGQDDSPTDQQPTPSGSLSSSNSHDDAGHIMASVNGSSHRNPRGSFAGGSANTNDGRLLGPVRLATGNSDANRRRNASYDAESSNDVRQDMYPGSSRNGSTSSQSQSQHPLTQLLPDLATSSSSSSTAQALSRLAQHHNGDEESFRDFVALTALGIPWANRLLKPRWDLMRVLHLATQRLGLTFDYIEEDSSISFLALDFENASGKALTMGQGMGADANGAPNGNTMALASTLRWHVIPDNMQPSSLCGAVPHHPFVDLSFPWPAVRDRILTAAACGLVNEHNLCVDIWPGDNYQESGAEPPYWVHGDDAFDPEAYEVSDRFARKYPWLLDSSIIRRTNWWRRQQGKAELPADIVRISQSFAPLLSAQMSRLLETAVSPTSRSALLSSSPFSSGGAAPSRFAPVNDEPMLGAGGGGEAAGGVEAMEGLSTEAADPQTSASASASMKMGSIAVPVLPPMALPTSIGGALPCHLDESQRQTFHDSMPFLTGAGAGAGNGTAANHGNGDPLHSLVFSHSVS